MKFEHIREMALAALGLGAAVGLAGSAAAQSIDTPVDGSVGEATTQRIFFENTVCFNPQPGTLFLQRCLDTNENGGINADISSNSESSLFPNQTAVAASNSLARAEALAAETQERLENIRDEEGDEPGSGSGTIASFGPWSLFASVQGEWFEQQRLDYVNERGFDGDRFQFAGGADYRISPGSRIGLIVSYEDYKLDFDGEPDGVGFNAGPSAGSIKSETISIAAFGTFALGESAWLDASAGIGWSDNDFTRNAIFQTGTRSFFDGPDFNRGTPITQLDVNAVGSATSNEYFFSLGVGADFSKGEMNFGPYVRANYARSEVDGYTEQDLNNTGLALMVSKQKATSLTGVVGASASWAISTTAGVILPQLRFEYEHEFEDDPRATITKLALDPRPINLDPITGNALAVVTDAPDRNYFNAGVGLLWILPGGIMPFVDYEALLGYRNFNRHRVTAGLRLEF